MGRRSILKGIMVGCIVMAFIFAGFQSDGVAAGKLRVSSMGDLIDVDPATMNTAEDRTVAQQVFEGLFEFDYMGKAPLKIVPRLAKKYEISPDAKAITVELNRGVQFHRGFGEFTSEDVVFSLKRHLDPNVASRVKIDVADIDRVEAVDKYTVKIYLKIPSAQAFILNLAWQSGIMVSKKAADKFGNKISTNPIGTGPYYFDRWNPGEKVILKKFNDYWGAPPKFDEIELWIIPEETVALGALERGDLDVVPITQQGSYERAKRIKDVDLRLATASAFHYIMYINHTVKPMDDVRVRRALAHATDLKTIAKNLGLEYFPSPLPSAVFSATDEFYKYDYNLDKAKQLLTEAGYPKGFNLLLVYSKAYLYEPVVLEVMNCWKKVVDVKLELIERAVFYKKLVDPDLKYHAGMGAVTRFAPYLYAENYVTGSPRNYGRYSNQKFEETITKARTASTEAEANRWWREFQKDATDDMVAYWPGTQRSLAAVRKDIKNVIVTPYLGMLDFGKAYRE